MTTISFMSESCHPLKSSIRHVVLVVCTRIQMLFCKALINGSGGLRLHTTLLSCIPEWLQMIQQRVWTSSTKHRLARRSSSKRLQGLFSVCTLLASESLTSKQQTRVISQNPSEKWSIHTISYMNIYICRLYTVRISFTPWNFMEFLHLNWRVTT